jgi:hypothetical protein
MQLGKMLSVGEVVEQAPIEEPAMAQPKPAQPAPAEATRNDDHGQVPAGAPAG